MSAAPAFCRLVLGDSEAAAAATADAVPTPPGRFAEIAGAWRACRPELERRRDALAWEDATPRQPSLAVALAALPDLERGAVAAQALGLEPGEVEQALGAAPGAAQGLLARAHVRLGGFGPPAGAACAEERERLATAPEGTRTRHCADCRAFAAAVSEQRHELRRAARAEETAPSGKRNRGPRGGSAALTLARVRSAATRPGAAVSVLARVRSAPSSVGRSRSAAASVLARVRSAPSSVGRPRSAAASILARVRSAASAARRPGAAAAVAARVRSAASAARRPGAAASAVARLRSAASAAAVTVGPILEPKERGQRIAVALAVLLLAGLAGFGVVSAIETPRQGGGDGVVTATPVDPLPPGVGPTKP